MQFDGGPVVGYCSRVRIDANERPESMVTTHVRPFQMGSGAVVVLFLRLTDCPKSLVLQKIET